jgi:hypothetical protein
LSMMIRRRLAELIGVSADELQRLLPARTGAAKPDVARPARKRTAPSAEGRMLAHMLDKPALAARFDLAVAGDAPLPLRALGELAQYIRDHDMEVMPAMILEHFRGREEGMAISEALNARVLSEAEAARADLDAEFDDFLARLRSKIDRARWKELAGKAAVGKLPVEEEAEYRGLARRIGGTPA